MDPSRHLAEHLARFAIATKDFPPEAINEGKRILLDQLGCQIACAPLPWSVAYRDAIRSFGAGDGATVVYFGDRLPLDQAAFVNSCFGHGGEIDDTQLRSSNHSGAVVVPPVLAVAEQRKLSGAQALEATVVGLEVMIRIGAAAAPHLFNRGHHVPPATGPFGSAAGSSRILGLDEATCTNAIAIAGSHAGGHLEYTHAGGSVKRCHCAIPAMAGLRSAVMARNGITGPHSVLEGQRGFFKTFAGEHDADVVTRDLGRDYLLLETAYKPVASPFSAHGCVEAFDRVVRQHRLTADEIESIVFGTSAFIIKNVGTNKQPRGILEAHFSLAFGCAVRLFRGGNGFYDYREEDLADPRFIDITRRVSLEVDPIAEEEQARLKTRSGVVTVTTRDGRRLEARVQYSKGHPKNPLRNAELTAKFMDLVTPRLGAERARRIADAVWEVERLPDAGELVRLTLKDR